MSGPEISVIIPALNAALVLPQQLDAMTAQNPGVEWELVVVDNGSTDATARVANSFADRLPLRLVAESKRGVNRARNHGVAVTTGAKILFTDADDIVGPAWVSTMSAAIHPGTIVGGWLDRRYLPPDPPQRLDHSPISAIFSGDWLPYPIGCCMGWDRAVLEQIGEFDPTLEYGGDDVDAAWRAQLLGAELLQADAGASIVRRERADPTALRDQSRMFGKAEAILARRFSPRGHPGIPLRRAALRWARATSGVLTSRGPETLENKRRRAYHGAVAQQLLRYRLRLDPVPEAARSVR